MNPEELTLPQEPRFTLGGLREIRIPAGDSRSTLSAFVFIKGGKRREKIATLNDLTESERAAALAFILRYGKTIIKKKDPPPSLEALPELEIPPDLDGPQGEKGTPNQEKP